MGGAACQIRASRAQNPTSSRPRSQGMSGRRKYGSVVRSLHAPMTPQSKYLQNEVRPTPRPLVAGMVGWDGLGHRVGERRRIRGRLAPG